MRVLEVWWSRALSLVCDVALSALVLGTRVTYRTNAPWSENASSYLGDERHLREVRVAAPHDYNPATSKLGQRAYNWRRQVAHTNRCNWSPSLQIIEVTAPKTQCINMKRWASGHWNYTSGAQIVKTWLATLLFSRLKELISCEYLLILSPQGRLENYG